ncbi:hypothetical protein BASA81_008655 [Batrachochytrium salamandrivorans]|nr:hypothetical protein BASA81_008655 [Batrachochytrium salamandrivorans]
MFQLRSKRVPLRNVKLGFGLLILVWLVHTLVFAWRVIAPDEEQTFAVDSNDNNGEEEGEVGEVGEEEEGEEEDGNLETTSDPSIITKPICYGFSKSSFWAELGGMEQASSWSSPEVSWFAFTHCAVYSATIEDRFVLDTALCCPYTPTTTQRWGKFNSLVQSLGCSEVNAASALVDLYQLDDTELVVVHTANEAKLVSAIQAKQLKLTLQQQHFTGATNEFRVERRNSNLALLQGKQFLLRTLVFPEQVGSIGSHLGHFAVLTMLQAPVELDPRFPNVNMYVSSIPNPNLCLEDIPQHLPIDVVVKRMQQLATWVLQSRFSTTTTTSATRVLGEPLCVDFEWTKDSQVLLKHWSPYSECRPSGTSSKCKGVFQPHTDLAALLAGTSKLAKLDSSLAACRPAIASSSFSYDELILARNAIHGEIHSKLFAKHKSYYHLPMAGDHGNAGVKCTTCEYVNHHFAKRCDLCGGKLAVGAGGGEFTSAKFSGQAQAGEYRQRLVRAFTQHDPSRLVSVDVLLERYAGEEAALVQRVENQYKALNSV